MELPNTRRYHSMVGCRIVNARTGVQFPLVAPTYPDANGLLQKLLLGRSFWIK